MASMFPFVSNFVFLFLVASLLAKMNSLSFNFPDFEKNKDSLDTQGSTVSFESSQLKLTPRDPNSGNYPGNQTGRALHKTAVLLWEWDGTTKRMTDFATSFNFSISSDTYTNSGDGLAFLLVPNNTHLPPDVHGGSLGTYPINDLTGNFLNDTKIVAVEFDTYKNPWDPSPCNHIGIDVQSMVSSAYAAVCSSLVNNTAQASIFYNSSTKNLSVSLSVNGTLPYNVAYTIDLSTVLPEWIQVGFSASTGNSYELHNILAWSFNSTMGETPITPTTEKGKGGLVAGLTVGISLILVFGVVIAWIRLRRKSPTEGNPEAPQFYIDEDFDTEAGPKRFAYAELSQATNNFANQGKLGEGGFGGVYKGLLTNPGTREIAVKKIKSGSKQGKKEYISEVKIISRLRHRNLVQLLGWCHDHGELLLVYEFMPNGSLDFHLFGRELVLLPWPTRFKIALGLASAVLYLHEEWEQSVVHRDIKSSNVMLDFNFNPKLGDFGLARLADYDVGLQTTAPAGTPGYLAPECLLTGKASKESDVYSYGIVALELACGRKVIEIREEASKVNLVEWVWDLYGKGIILEAVDNNLEGEFDEEQAKRLMVVGLWCSHPDVGHRPSISQAIAALKDETPLPSLPPQLPVPIYVSPGMNVSHLSSYTSFGIEEGNYQHTSSSIISTSTTSSSDQQSGKSTSTTYPLLCWKRGARTISESSSIRLIR